MLRRVLVPTALAGCAAAQECAFTTNQTGQNCYPKGGGQLVKGVSSEEACRAACCADAKCDLWMYCPFKKSSGQGCGQQNNKTNGHGCFIGPVKDCIDAEGWVTFSRSCAPNCPVPPPAPMDRFHCDKTTYKCSPATTGHGDMAECQFACKAPQTPAPAAACEMTVYSKLNLAVGASTIQICVSDGPLAQGSVKVERTVQPQSNVTMPCLQKGQIAYVSARGATSCAIDDGCANGTSSCLSYPFVFTGSDDGAAAGHPRTAIALSANHDGVQPPDGVPTGWTNGTYDGTNDAGGASYNINVACSAAGKAGTNFVCGPTKNGAGCTPFHALCPADLCPPPNNTFPTTGDIDCDADAAIGFYITEYN